MHISLAFALPNLHLIRKLFLKHIFCSVLFSAWNFLKSLLLDREGAPLKKSWYVVTLHKELCRLRGVFCSKQRYLMAFYYFIFCSIRSCRTFTSSMLDSWSASHKQSLLWCSCYGRRVLGCTIKSGPDLNAEKTDFVGNWKYILKEG